MRIHWREPARQLASVAYRHRIALGSHLTGGTPMALRGPWAAGDDEFSAAEGCQDLRSLRDHRLQRLEAVLFLARDPLTTRKLSQYANLADGTEARTLIRQLNTLYDSTGRAFRVERVAGGYQLLTRRKLANWVRRLDHVPRQTRLSVPAMETLAIVAYRQPILRADIEGIRGVSCEEILRQLMDRDLVRIGGRSEELGRPYLYATTKSFLRVFGLESLDSLPRVGALKSPAEPAAVGNVQPTVVESLSGDLRVISSEEESGMRVSALSDRELGGFRHAAIESDQVVDPRLAQAAEADEEEEGDEEEEDDDYEDEEEEEDDYEDFDDMDLDEDFDEEEEEDEDEDLEDEWEEVEEDEEEEEDVEDEEDWDEDEEEEEEEEEDFE